MQLLLLALAHTAGDGPVCLQESGVDYAGNDVGSMQARSAQQCCHHCYEEPACLFYTFWKNDSNDDVHNCLFKSSKTGRILNSTRTSGEPPSRALLECNKTLASGSILKLTDKLEMTGNRLYDDDIWLPDTKWECKVVGPDTGPPATIIMPDNDCMLAAANDVTISGHIRFVVGKKTQKFDCCRDGEAHGSILCSSAGSLTFAKDSVVTVETVDADTVVKPGGFWTSKHITVHGSVSALLNKGQMTGVNGLLTGSRGVYVSSTGVVNVTGQKVARGAAIQGGDDGTVVNGTVQCAHIHAGDAGGCIAAGNNFTAGPTSKLIAHHALTSDTGGLINSGHEGYFYGEIVADSINSTDGAGAVMSGDNITLLGDASVAATNIYGGGGPSVLACTFLTIKDNARFTVNNTYGTDGGAIGVNVVKIQDRAAVSCENSYAGYCGGCILATIEIGDKASVTAKNVTGMAFGGALCGMYPKQTITVSGDATVEVTDSRTQSRDGIGSGGAMAAYNITFTGGAFKVRLKNPQADCGAALMAMGAVPGEGFVLMDSSKGGTLLIEDAKEVNTTLGCLNVEANFLSGPDSSAADIKQPCSGCEATNFPPAKKADCTCTNKKRAAVRECCST